MDLKQTLENYIDNQKRKHLDCEMCGKRYSNKGSLREVFKSNMINIGEGLMFHLGKVQWGGWWTFSTRSPDLKVHKKILEPPRLTILPELEIEPKMLQFFVVDIIRFELKTSQIKGPPNVFSQGAEKKKELVGV